MPAALDSTLPTPTPATPEAIFLAAADGAKRGVHAALATVIERHGSAPGTPGQKLYLARDGTCLGTVGGGASEREVLAALRSGEGREPELRTFKLGAELGMCCGGRLTVMIEPLVPAVSCLLVGAGHVAGALGPLLVTLGFAVTVVDPRPEWADVERFPGATVVVGEWDEAPSNAAGACLVMTHDHGRDQDAIEWALRRGFAFVGGVGSRAKAERTRQRLALRGVGDAAQARVRMPVGLSIGARSPAEIAVSIAAELVAWRHRKSDAQELDEGSAFDEG